MCSLKTLHPLVGRGLDHGGEIRADVGRRASSSVVETGPVPAGDLAAGVVGLALQEIGREQRTGPTAFQVPSVAMTSLVPSAYSMWSWPARGGVGAVVVAVGLPKPT